MCSFDVELPIECDDEYWDHPNPELAWKQPPGKPSRVASFVHTLKIMRIVAFTLRTVVCVGANRKSLSHNSIVFNRQVEGLTRFWWPQLGAASANRNRLRPQQVAKYHSRTSYSSHMFISDQVLLTLKVVRWGQTHKDPAFFTQSALLNMLYHRIQILVHRPFIPSPRKAPSPVSFPSLAICTNAARSCIQIVETFRRLKGIPLQMSEVDAIAKLTTVSVRTHIFIPSSLLCLPRASSFS